MLAQIVYVTGGQDLTVTSTAAASAVANVHFEVIGFTNLVLDVPDLTMTGIYQSVSGTRIPAFPVFFFVSFCSSFSLPFFFHFQAL